MTNEFQIKQKAISVLSDIALAYKFEDITIATTRAGFESTVDQIIADIRRLDCPHDEVFPMEGCLECGAAYHEVRSVDPDVDLER